MIGDISQPLMGSGEKEGGVGVCLWKSRHGRAVGRRATPRVANLSNGKAYLGGQLALMHGYEGCESLSFTFSFPRFRLRVSVVPSRFQCLEAEKDVLGLMMMALSWRDLREQGECEDTLFIVMIFGVRTQASHLYDYLFFRGRISPRNRQSGYHHGEQLASAIK